MKNTCRAAAVLTILAALLSGLTAPCALASGGTGVSLTPLDATRVDDVLHSSNGGTRAIINFVNRTNWPVDIYWIDYAGHRVLYQAGLPVNSTWMADTFLNHTWLVVVSGTGGTTARDTGVTIAGFVASTTNGDTAIITNPASK